MVARQRPTAILAISRHTTITYSAPVSAVTTRCRLTPSGTDAGRRVRSASVRLHPVPAQLRRFDDEFGNEILEFRHETIENHLTIEATIEVDRSCTARRTDGLGNCDSAERFLEPTLLTLADATLGRALAVMLSARRELVANPRSLALELNAFVHRSMRYRSGVTDTATSASAAWSRQEGVCQDYSHVLLALCRRAELPSRYVAGYVLGQTGPTAMHAWVEVCAGREWLPLDPVAGATAGNEYLVVARGRDYRDVKAISGEFWGDGKASLHSETRVDYRSASISLNAGARRRSGSVA
jgi:transglutaminase-like putative cysteine protease